MKKIWILCAATLGTTLFAGCEKVDPPHEPQEPVSLEISGNEFMGVSVEGEQKTIEVTCNTDWAITGMPEWIGVEPANGNGNAVVTITFEPNDTGIRSATLTVTAGSVSLPINITQLTASEERAIIPDQGFRAWLEREEFVRVIHDASGWVEITDAGKRAQEMRPIHTSTTKLVRSLEGLHYFPELLILDARELGISEVDLSENVKLRTVYLHGNPGITAVDVTMLPDLRLLYIQHCNVMELDVTQNPKLETLGIEDNPIIEINLTNNPALKNLYATTCCRNAIPGDRFSEKIASISRLDLSNCTELTDLQCGWNVFLTELDVTMLPKLKSLHTFGCAVTTLDTSQNPELENFQPMFTPSLTTVDVSNNPKLQWFYLAGTGVTSIDLSNNPELISFTFDDTTISSLDVSNNTKLTELFGARSAIASLDLSHNPLLVNLELAGSQAISEIDLSGNMNLQYVNFVNTGISSLDLSGHAALRKLGFSPKQGAVSELLDISGCTNLGQVRLWSYDKYMSTEGNMLILGGIIPADEETPEMALYSQIKNIIADNLSIGTIKAEGCPHLEVLSTQNGNVNKVELLNNPNLHKFYKYGSPQTTVTQSGNAADFEVITTPRP